jgi:hypothetical protein
MNGPNWLDRSREASDLLSRGRTDDAILIFQEVARANPRVPDAHNNLAVSLKTAGRLKEAVVSYRRALKLKPRLDVARLNLARVLRSLGQHDQALTAFANALRNTPDSEELHFEIRITFLNMQFDRPSSAAREILLSFFQNTAKDLQPFADPTTRLLLSNRRFQELVAAAEKAYPDGEPGRLLAPRELADPLLIAVLTWTIVPFPQIEAWITLARRQLLNRVQRGERIVTSSTLLWAMAAQCQATELAQYVTPTERHAAFQLVRTLGEDDVDKIAIAGMFLPLATVPAARDLARKIALEPGDRSPMHNVLLRTIINRDAEREIETGIQSLTSIEEETSLAVREHYEANPTQDGCPWIGKSHRFP